MDALRSKVNKLELENDNLSRDKRGLVEDNQKLKQKCQRMNRCVERHDITVAECREKQNRMKDQLDFAQNEVESIRTKANESKKRWGEVVQNLERQVDDGLRKIGLLESEKVRSSLLSTSMSIRCVQFVLFHQIIGVTKQVSQRNHILHLEEAVSRRGADADDALRLRRQEANCMGYVKDSLYFFDSSIQSNVNRVILKFIGTLFYP